MKILIAANNAVGLEKFRKELIDKLLEEHQVYICLPNGEYIEGFKERGCVFIPCEFNRRGKNPFADFKQVLFYKKNLKEIKPDVVLTYTIKPNIYCGIACAAMNIPYISNITGLGTAVENGGILQVVTCALYKYGLRKAKRVFFQNVENRDFMLRHKIVRNNYKVIPGSGVNLSRYCLLEYPEKSKVDFVFISRIMKEKGINQYLDAAEYIKSKYEKTTFHICGGYEKGYEGKLEMFINKDIVVYHGHVSDIREILAITHCTIHPTYYPEGMSNVLLESCACGRPIITTNRSGCREIVENGRNGLVVEENKSEDLISKIEMFLALPWEKRREMGLAGRRKVETEFDRQIIVDTYMQEINDIKKVNN